MEAKKHILVVPQWYPNKTDIQLGGFIQQQARLISSDFEVTVLYPHPLHDAHKDFDCEVKIEESVREIRVYYKQDQGILRRLKNFSRFKKALSIGLKQIETPIDLCHLHVPMRSGLILEQIEKDIPVVVTSHWSGHLNGEYDNLPAKERKLYLTALKRAKKITSVSEDLQKALTKNTGARSSVIPNPIFGTPTPYPSNEKGVKILTVGDLNNQTKNYIGLLESFSKALKKNENLFLDIIGDGPDRKMILHKISKLGLEEKVKLLGRMSQSEVQERFKDYHFFVNNSITETFGMAIAEAIANGRPVVCTASGGPNHFIRKENGLLIPLGETAAYVAAINKMTDNYLNYNPTEISNSILAIYGENKVKEEWCSLYKSIL
ncbi:MAG: glycosyltransferase [Crocinitomicaceae bacterium]|nr:glycosyltransferase [Crocinitomicaceae bacterium]